MVSLKNLQIFTVYGTGTPSSKYERLCFDTVSASLLRAQQPNYKDLLALRRDRFFPINAKDVLTNIAYRDNMAYLFVSRVVLGLIEGDSSEF